MFKKFLLFAGDDFYPRGGWGDFRGDFDTVREAQLTGRQFDWYHVIDSETREFFCKGKYQQ